MIEAFNSLSTGLLIAGAYFLLVTVPALIVWSQTGAHWLRLVALPGLAYFVIVATLGLASLGSDVYDVLENAGRILRILFGSW